MISIFPSEPMVPAQGPSNRSPEATPEPKDSTERSAFSDLVKQDDQAPPQGEAGLSQDQTEQPNQTGTRRDLILSLQGDATDPALVSADAAIPEAEIVTAEIETPKLALIEADTAESTKLAQSELAAEQAKVLDIAPRETKAPVTAQVQPTQPGAELEIARVAETARPDAEPELQTKTKADLAAPVELKKEVAAKNTGTAAEAASDAEIKLAVQPEGEAGETLRIQRGDETADTVRFDARDVPNAKTADAAATGDKLILGAEKAVQTMVSRDAPLVPGETVMTAVQTQQSSQAQVTPTGLTPTAPGVQVASPNEITSIILNNLRNGVEAQEQLIVQLDPPELGRVSIDFKFDAQGVQQITVTTENPEALKRLRELHFELTEALKDHGLSEKNMSFKQEAGDQSGSSWQMPDRGSGAAGAAALETGSETTPIVRTNATAQSSNRLDLTL